jgi:hypothetical protein
VLSLLPTPPWKQSTNTLMPTSTREEVVRFGVKILQYMDKKEFPYAYIDCNSSAAFVNDVFSRTCTEPSPSLDRAPLQAPDFSCLLIALLTPSCHLKSKPYCLQVHSRTRLQCSKSFQLTGPRVSSPCVKGPRVFRPRVAPSENTHSVGAKRGFKHDESQGYHSVDACSTLSRLTAESRASLSTQTRSEGMGLE